jgi:hypothetical protein
MKFKIGDKVKVKEGWGDTIYTILKCVDGEDGGVILKEYPNDLYHVRYFVLVASGKKIIKEYPIVQFMKGATNG